MSIKSILSKNGVQLRSIKGWNNADIVRSALENKGIKIHASTVSNILDKGKPFSSGTVDALSAAFCVSPVDLLNPLGFDENGKPVGREIVYPEDAINYSIYKVLNIVKKLEISDQAWINETIMSAVFEYESSGPQAADDLILKSLAFGGLDKPKQS